MRATRRRRWNVVVTIQAGDLFDQVFLDFHVEAPAIGGVTRKSSPCCSKDRAKPLEQPGNALGAQRPMPSTFSARAVRRRDRLACRQRRPWLRQPGRPGRRRSRGSAGWHARWHDACHQNRRRARNGAMHRSRSRSDAARPAMAVGCEEGGFQEQFAGVAG